MGGGSFGGGSFFLDDLGGGASLAVPFSFWGCLGPSSEMNK